MVNLARFKARIAEDGVTLPSDSYLESLLETATYAILERRYPFSEFPTAEVTDTETGAVTTAVVLPARFIDLQLRIAVDMYGKIGAEGQKSHSENGVSRSWASGYIDPELLRGITPLVGVV